MKTIATILLIAFAIRSDAALNIGNVGVVSQPSEIPALAMDGWQVVFDGDQIDGSRFVPQSRVGGIFRPISPNTPIDFKCRASHDGGTWLLFYANDPWFAEGDPGLPLGDFISGFEWRDGILYEVTVNGRCVLTEVARYEFAQLLTKQTTAPANAGFVFVGSWKEFTDGPDWQAATIELLSL